MSTTLSRSQTLAFCPKCCLKMPMVPGPQTSCVMSTSTFTQMFSPGAAASRPAARARIFSVIVCDGIASSRIRQVGRQFHYTPAPRRATDGRSFVGVGRIVEQVNEGQPETGKHVPAV